MPAGKRSKRTSFSGVSFNTLADASGGSLYNTLHRFASGLRCVHILGVRRGCYHSSAYWYVEDLRTKDTSNNRSRAWLACVADATVCIAQSLDWRWTVVGQEKKSWGKGNVNWNVQEINALKRIWSTIIQIDCASTLFLLMIDLQIPNVTRARKVRRWRPFT